MRRLLVIEDGHEYEEFARLFLGDAFEVCAVHCAAEALARVGEQPVDALLIDLRFNRAPPETLVGDVDETARRLFGGDRERAVRYLEDQQGTLVLAALREAGCDAPAVFVHDFAPRRLENLRRLYGRVDAVASFDAACIRAAIEGAA